NAGLRLTPEAVRQYGPPLAGPLLDPSPPARQLRRRQSVLRSQQQQVVCRAESRVLETTQCAAPSRVLQARLQAKHLAYAEYEALGYRHVGLSLAGGLVAGVKNCRELVPALGRSRFDDLSNRPV